MFIKRNYQQMSIALQELDYLERNAIIEYLSAHPNALKNLKADGADLLIADVDFPEDFFDVLSQMGTSNAEKARGLKCHSWVRKNISKFYDYRWTQFHLEFALPSHHMASATTVNDVSTYLFQFLTKEVGMGELVRRYATDILEGVKAYRSTDLFIQLFGVLLHSGQYDTLDTKAYLSWDNTLVQYQILVPQNGVRHPHVRLRDVPYLLRKCLLPNQGTEGDASQRMIPVQSNIGTWNRCRGALNTWCDKAGRVPAVVADPKFYIPPYPKSHPYVSKSYGAAADEGRFISFDSQILVPTIQILVLMLLNFKEERLTSIVSGQ